MNEPNNNLKSLNLALRGLIQNKRVTTILRALVMADVLLTLFLFGQDYFHWWRNPLPPAVDATLVGLMIVLSVATFAFFALLAGGYFYAFCHAPRRPDQPRSRLVRMALAPLVYGLPSFWGCAYLSGGNTRLWGALAVAYLLFETVLLFILVAGEKFIELRRGRLGISPGSRAAAPLDVISERRTVRSRLYFFLWRQWWWVTHPAYVRKMRPLDRALYVTVARIDVRGAAAYLSRGADPNLRLAFDGPLLSFAISRGHGEIVRQLLEAGADPDAVSPNTGVTPLICAAIKNDLVSARILLEHKAVVESQSRSGVTALSFAGRKGNAEMVRLLVAHGADVNARSKDGGMALITAAWFGHIETVRALLDAGADPTLRDDKGTDALEYAKRKNRTPVIALLEAATPEGKPAMDT